MKVNSLSILFPAIFALLFLVGCGGDTETVISEGKSLPAEESLPQPQREFRAAWVATVDNIDWPSSPTLSVTDQKREAMAILDRLVDLNMNAVIFQVRPQADALYQSKHEPWSYYLTGEQGKAPSPLYDPLEFWIEQAHQRGIQLHAWFNPYRANHRAHPGEISDKSIIKQNPELVVKLGNDGYWWMLPSEQEAKKHTLKVILDVVERYDIDAVHFDDYFYPYPAYHNNKDFPDDSSYTQYQKRGGKLARADWRRDSVNQLIEELGPRIKATKSHVEFGISPFGIWRPGHPKNVKGLDQYSVLYADARKWIHEGWLDYSMPQLYWPISAKHQSFTELLTWWKAQNKKQHHLWPGLKLGGTDSATELVNQVKVTRATISANPGVCVFSMKRFMNPDYAGAKALKQGLWAEPALIPSTPWIDQSPPAPPKITLLSDSKGSFTTDIKPPKSDSFLFVINEKKDGTWLAAKIVPGNITRYPVADGIEAISVRSVDRTRNLSKPMFLEVPR